MNGMCDCGKRMFFTEQDAKMAVNDIIERRRQGWAPWRRERRAYRCLNDRNTWHLTSWETPNGALMTKQGVGNLTPKDVANLIEELYPDARVEEARNGYKVYPPDKSRSPVFFPDRFGNGTGRSNCISQLKRAGLDILSTPEPETPMPTNGRAPLTQPLIDPTPAESVQRTPGVEELRKRIAGLENDDAIGTLDAAIVDLRLKATAAETKLAELAAGQETILQMLAEAEKLDKTRRDAILNLQTQRSQAFARIKALEKTLGQQLPELPKVDPTAELDAAILTFMAGHPLALTASVISANITVDATGNQVGKRLQALANDGKVTAVDRPGVAKLYTYKKESDNA